MTTPTLYSIAALKPEDVIHTGAKPVRAFCNNMNYYLVKHEKIGVSQLLNEYIAASFLRIWELNTPCFAFVTIKTEHIPLGLHEDVQPHFFKKPCFGTRYERNWGEVDKVAEKMAFQQKHLFTQKLGLLKIALFDLWVANEDRNANNYNLLLASEAQYRFIPIDHQAIFNYDNLENELMPLTEPDSLLSSPMVDYLFSKKELNQASAALQLDYFECVQSCGEQLENILSGIPKELENRPFQNIKFIAQ
ncbi:MAG: hypothetical protein HC892_17575 [Saprospiraceae bacterium]|nr:hypothetical protein [Saprospiraceae bacterium]